MRQPVSPITTIRLILAGRVGSIASPRLSRDVACGTRASQTCTGNAASGAARGCIAIGAPFAVTVGQAAPGAMTVRTDRAPLGASSTHGRTGCAATVPIPAISQTRANRNRRILIILALITRARGRSAFRIPFRDTGRENKVTQSAPPVCRRHRFAGENPSARRLVALRAGFAPESRRDGGNDRCRRQFRHIHILSLTLSTIV